VSEVSDEEVPDVPVVFTLRDAPDASTVALCGDFNGWEHGAILMDRVDQDWTVTVDLEPGRSYRYQFLVDGQWEPERRRGGSSMPDLFETWYSVVTVSPLETASARATV
jgi:1,4-alpha-glucan branching enzyme